MRKSIRYSFTGFVALSFVSVVSFANVFPAIGAVICPSFYGMEYAGPNIYVEKEMPAQMRAELLRDAKAAASTVQTFYGALHRQPYLVVCSTEACNYKLGGRGTAKGATYSTPFATIIRISPRGINRTILAHEFSHVELYSRNSLWRQITGNFPAWFDEGVAIIVSDDPKFLKPGTTAAERCIRDSQGLLPTAPSDWGLKSYNDPMLYADAACRVLHWMEANGGKAGFMKTLDDIGNGIAFTPENGQPKLN